MGGIIVVDFIDMNLAEDRQMLYERMCKNMQKDRARHNILPLSKFGLMQITRQRVRPAMDVNVEETCPTCNGTGKIKSSILFTDQLERKIDRLVNKIGIAKLTIQQNTNDVAKNKERNRKLTLINSNNNTKPKPE